MLANLKLKNFRNYEYAEISLSPTLNIITAPNGYGKTNLLEAIYLCGFGKSFRGTNQRFVNFDAEFARIEASAPERTKITIVIQADGTKKITLNEKGINKLSELLGYFPITYIGPGEIAVVSGPPSIRRKMMDAHICQFDPIYTETLISYHKILKRRNAALKGIAEQTIAGGMILLDTLEDQLANYGARIIAERMKFLDAISPLAADFFSTIHGEKAPEIKFIYQSTIQIPQDITKLTTALKTALESMRRRDLALFSTTIGPHRDDFTIVIDGLPARRFASWGQSRMISLAIYFSAAKLTGDKSRKIPTVLLDDALAELDPERARNALEIAPTVAQVVAVTPHEMPEVNAAKTKKFRMPEPGKIEEEN